jgi:hypothetical protein
MTYEINGIRVGSTLERRVKAGWSISKSEGLKAYYEEREAFRKAQLKQDLLEAPRTDIKFVWKSVRRGGPKVLVVKTIRTVNMH